MVKIQGITVELNGDTTGLNDALKSVDKQTKSVQSELKSVDRLLKFDPSNVELLSQKQQLLGDAVNSTSQRLDALKQAQSEVERQFANGDIGADQYRAFQREIIATEGQLDSFRKQLQSVDARLEVDTDTSALDKMQDELRDVAETAKKVGKGIGDGLKKGAEVGAKAVAGIGLAAAGAVAGVGAFVESQKEMSTDLARLKTNAETAGFSLESVEAGFKKVAAVSGEADSAVEAMSNLMATDMSENQLAEMLDYVNGAAIKFSDTLKTEGIADGIQETFATGEAIGPFAELLERSGVNLDVFNKGLANASKTGTETDYVLQQLSELGLKSTYDAYLENNSAIADYNLAQVESQKKLAEFSDVLRPFVTTLMEMGNIILDVVLGNKDLATGFGELVTIIGELGTKFMNAAKDAMPKFIEGIQSALPKVLEAGIKILTKVIEGIGNTLPKLTSKGLELISKLASTLIANLPKLLDAGVKMVTSLIGGIANSLPKLVTTALNLVLKLASTIISNLPKIIEAGVKILTSIVSGIGKALPQLVTYLVGTFIPKIVKIISDADWKQIGKDIINGLIKGISSMTKSAIEAITGVVGSVVNAAKKFLGIASPSKVFTQIGKWTGEGLAIGVESTQKRNEKAIKDIADTITAITRKNAAEISVIAKKAEEDRTKVQSDYQKKRRNLKKADAKKIQELESDMHKKLNDINKKASAEMQKKESELSAARLEAINKFMDGKKKANELSLIEEAQYWRTAYKQFKTGSAENLALRQSYQENVQRIGDALNTVNTNHLTQAQKINDDLIKNEQDLNQKYKDTLENRYKTILNYYGLFDAVTKGEEVEKSELSNNLQDQVASLKDWASQIDQLKRRRVSKGLIDELQQMGVKSTEQLRALNSMTDSELSEYQKLYQEKMKIAREQAVKELEPLRLETQYKIQELRQTANAELETLNIEWQKAIKKVVGGTDEKLKTLHQVGKNAGQGLLKGLSSMQDSLVKKASEIANSISKTIKGALQIKSPSRVMMGFGENIGEGLIIGMDDMINDVAKSSARLSGAVKNAHSSIASSSNKSQANQVAQQQIINQSNNIDLSGLIAVIAQMVDRPIYNTLLVDGNEMAHVVSNHQYGKAAIAGLTKGVNIR